MSTVYGRLRTALIFFPNMFQILVILHELGGGVTLSDDLASGSLGCYLIFVLFIAALG